MAAFICLTLAAACEREQPTAVWRRIFPVGPGRVRVWICRRPTEGATVYVPRGYNAQLETGTTNGGMRVDFPITVRGSLTRRISTQLGSGGPTVRVMTTNGGVHIAER